MRDSITSMNDALFLGIDLGTTNVKALLADQTGGKLSEASAAAGIRFAPGGAAEQDIEQIWGAALDALKGAVKNAESAGVPRVRTRVRAIGVSSQGGAIQILDARGAPLGATIGWQDSRGAPWDAAVTEKLGREWFIRRTGFARSAGAIGQLLRLREEGTLTRGCSLAFAGDLVVGRLCGTRAHDATSLSEPCLLNPSLGAADPELLELLDLDAERMPLLIPAGRAAGALLPDAAGKIGLEPGIPVGPAVHDQYAAAIGCNVMRAGDTMLGLGTAWVLLAATATLAPPVAGVALVGRHPVDGLFGQMLSMANGGSSLTWAVQTLGLGASGVEEVDALAGSAPPGAGGLRFRPLLPTGSGLPAASAGRLDGLRLEHAPGHILRAVIEGLANELGRFLAMMREGGVEVGRLVLCGKAAASLLTPQVIADTVGLAVDCATLAETSSLGAAILARKLCEPKADLTALSDEMKPAMRRVHTGAGREAAASRLRRYIEELTRESFAAR